MAKLPLERSRFHLPSGEGLTTNTLPLVRAGAYYEAAGRDITAAAAVMMRYLLDEEAQREQERGQKEGSAVQFGRDENGRLVPVLADEAAHRAYRKAFNDAAVAKYLATVQLDAVSELTRIRREADGDPELFRQRAEAWIDGATERMPGLVAVPFRAMASHLAGQHHVKLVEEQTKREIEQARVNSLKVIDNAMTSLFDVVARGGAVESAMAAVEGAIRQAGNIFTPEEVQRLASQARVTAAVARGTREVMARNGSAAGFTVAEALMVGPSSKHWRPWMDGLDLGEREAVRKAVHAAAVAQRQMMEMRREDAFHAAREAVARVLRATGGDPEALLKASTELAKDAWKHGVNAGVFLEGAGRAVRIAEGQQERLLAELDDEIDHVAEVLRQGGPRAALTRLAAVQGALEGVPRTPAVRQRLDQIVKLDGAAWAAFGAEEAQKLAQEFDQFEEMVSRLDPGGAQADLDGLIGAWQRQIEQLPAALRPDLSAVLNKRSEQARRVWQQGVRTRLEVAAGEVKRVMAALPSASSEEEVRGLLTELIDQHARAGRLIEQLDVPEEEKTALSKTWLQLEDQAKNEASMAKAGRLIAEYIRMGNRVAEDFEQRRALQVERERVTRELSELLASDPAMAMRVQNAIAQMVRAEQEMLANLRQPTVIRVQNKLDVAKRLASTGALTEGHVQDVEKELGILRGLTPPQKPTERADPHALVRRWIAEFEGEIAKLWATNEAALKNRDMARGAESVAARVAAIAALMKTDQLQSERLLQLLVHYSGADSEDARSAIGKQIIDEYQEIMDRRQVAARAADVARGTVQLADPTDEEKSLALLALLNPALLSHWVVTGQRPSLTEADIGALFGAPDGGRVMARIAKSEIIGPEVVRFFRRVADGMVMSDIEDDVGRGVATNLDQLLQIDPKSWHALRTAVDRGLRRTETFGGEKVDRPPMNPIDVLTMLGGTANWKMLRESLRKAPSEEQLQRAREKVAETVRSLQEGSWFPGRVRVVNEPSDAMKSRWLARALLLEVASLPGSSLREDAAMEQLVLGDWRYGLSAYTVPLDAPGAAIAGLTTGGFLTGWYNPIRVFTPFPIEAFGNATVQEAKRRAEEAASKMIERNAKPGSPVHGMFSSVEANANVRLLPPHFPRLGSNVFLVPQALTPEARDVSYEIVMATQGPWIRVLDDKNLPVVLKLDDLIRTSGAKAKAEAREGFRRSNTSLSDLAVP